MSLNRRIATLGHRAGAWKALGRLRSDRLTILTYHGVSEKADGLGVLSDLHAPAERFEAQVRYLAANHPVLPLADALGKLFSGAPLPRGAVCITFDDGYRNNAAVAFPILRRHGLPATIFLATRIVGTPHMLWHDRVAHLVHSSSGRELHLDDRVWTLDSLDAMKSAFAALTGTLKTLPEDRMLTTLAGLERQAGVEGPPEARQPDSQLMDWNEARTMRESGLVTFGSHTATHPILSNLDPARVHEELLESRERIEEELGAPCTVLAYPNGRSQDITDEVVQCASRVGYSHALTTVPGRAVPGSDPLRIPRLSAGTATKTIPEFAFQMAGARQWLVDRRESLRAASS